MEWCRSAAALVLCLALTPTVLAWINQYDQPADFECPKGQFLSHINSVHNNFMEDRVWDFQCSPVPVQGEVTNCHWTNFVNDWDQPVTYQCPNDGFLTGIKSVHNNQFEDRRFKYQCCEVPGAVIHACYFTNWENNWDGMLDYIVPTHKVLRGMDSYHNNAMEDRRFKFEVCDLEICS